LHSVVLSKGIQSDSSDNEEENDEENPKKKMKRRDSIPAVIEPKEKLHKYKSFDGTLLKTYRNR
jgi:hypothetical protein